MHSYTIKTSKEVQTEMTGRLKCGTWKKAQKVIDYSAAQAQFEISTLENVIVVFA